MSPFQFSEPGEGDQDGQIETTEGLGISSIVDGKLLSCNTLCLKIYRRDVIEGPDMIFL